MTYWDVTDLPRRTTADEILRGKAVNIAKNPKYDGYQRGSSSMVKYFFNKKSSGGAATRARSETLAPSDKSAIENKAISNEKLAEELHTPIIRNFEKLVV